ncbi:putative bifunctional diguanylate cyclase/phosphodiesterase [Methylobacterium nonmethylotrophicum]|uniref:EAL domain-containing protein n=1 Tax=Methylobacterium nonmethylotrophicum TaxID=1141884 RepID=A0A4Z0NVI3_9HYPH|nr:EAL domain-containing protein [Methylobacterium nonmethylotrophicum]TGE01293.1 EAL domain-containing protein [Methylobacterium nonmethylotrophicum]
MTRPPFLRTLRARLVGATVSTAAIALAVLVSLVALRSGQTLSEQAREVSSWSESQLSGRLLSDAKLAASRLQIQREDVERRFATLARRWDVAKAVFSGNTVAASELLRPALALADLDGVIAFDLNLRALTADRVDADLLSANAGLARTPLSAALRTMMARNDRERSTGFVLSLRWDEALARALAADETGTVVDVLGQPLFDDFGEVVGGLVGYRVLRPREPTLAAFSALSGRDVLIVAGPRLLSSAGAERNGVVLGEPSGAGLRAVAGADKVARCIPMAPSLRICAAAPLRELEQLTGKVVSIGEGSSRSLLSTLWAFAGLTLLLVAVVLLILSSRITRPLVRIAETVSEVARGNWHVAVPEVGRKDEVGDIARAVVVLEHSLAERDQLRDDVFRQNAALTEREGQLQEQNARFDAALNNMSQGLCMFSANGRLKVFNAQFLRIYGIAQGALASDPTHAEVRRLAGLAEAPGTGTVPPGPTATATLADGRCVAIRVQPMADGGWVETHEDVTASVRAQARITHLATHDALTGLPNRVLLAERMAAAISEHGRGGRAAAVICLDLDDFKGINDTLGHPAGDELLRQVGRRLTALSPPGSTVARLGGDEFAVVLSGSDLPDAAIRLADEALVQLKRPFLIADQLVSADASLGIAVSAEVDADGDHLLRRADLALYAAKAEGGRRVRVFEPDMEERQHQRRWLERELKLAIESGQIALHYQPLFDLTTNAVTGLEALARWHHPERGWISPGEFIPVAEATGLIDALGAYVLRTACTDAMDWPGHPRVAVNISPMQFRSGDLDQLVEQVLRATRLPSRRLELEITESVILSQDRATYDMLTRLRRLGVRFSMDDFGTGYSSLSSLNGFRFDKIKLDQSFVRNLLEKDEAAAIVHVVAELGRTLRITTTAEGVETPEQLARLRASGFSEVQGYLLSRPLPAAAVPRFLLARNDLIAAA